MISSFPYAIGWSDDNLAAIVHVTHGSQELGNALADVLFGAFNPAGRLVQTWPRSIDQLPDMLDYDIRNGRTYMYFEGEVLYPFGFGLSYTSFIYSNLCVAASRSSHAALTVGVDVANTGPRDGEEVVQLYVRAPAAPGPRPLKRLAGFRRVLLAAGETKTVRLEVDANVLERWDASERCFRRHAGEIEIQVGTSSHDIRLTHTLSSIGFDRA